jgi:DNA-binding transcriptional regulator YiaG
VAFLTVQNLRLKVSKKLPIALLGTGLAAHLRYRRETLGLTRRDAAKQIGVRGAAVGQWETGEHHPENEYWPAIIRFIGYDPICSDPQTVPEKIAFLCRHMGLSGVALAALLGTNKATIYKWEHGGRQRKGWAKAARLDELVLSVRTGQPLAPETQPRTGLAEALYRVRKDRNLTQDEAARHIGVHPTTYKLWEIGRREPQTKHLSAVISFLGF